MKLLVTGGAGFIGSNFIRYILKKYSSSAKASADMPDYQVVNLDLLTYAGNLENLKDVQENPNYRFVKGDIADKDLVSDLVKDTDIIVNFAAESHVDRSILDSAAFIHTNIVGTAGKDSTTSRPMKFSAIWARKIRRSTKRLHSRREARIPLRKRQPTIW